MRLRSIIAVTLPLVVLSVVPSGTEAQRSGRSADDSWEIEIPLEEGFRRVPREEREQRDPEPPPDDYEDEDSSTDSPDDRRSTFERYADRVAEPDDEEDAEDEGDLEDLYGAPLRPTDEPSVEERDRLPIDREDARRGEDARAAPTKDLSDQEAPEAVEDPDADEADELEIEAEPEEAAPVAVARELRLPSGGQAELRTLWEGRREALRELDSARAKQATSELLELREELGIHALPQMALAVLREGEKHLGRKDAADARASADLAVELAPKLPAAHWFRARALLSEDFRQVGAALVSLGRAAFFEVSSVPQRRVHLLNFLSTLLLGLLATGLCFLALVTVRTVRQYVHDFHHLFPKGAARIQTGVLAIAILIAPVLLNAGLLLVVLVLTAAVWFHTGWKERAVLALALLLFSASPHLAGGLSNMAAFWGTPAEDVWRVERTNPSPAAIAGLELRIETGEADWKESFALARFHKRMGRLERALELYDAAAEASPRQAFVHNNRGIVLYAMNDLSAAGAAFRRATELDPASVAAWHNLSKVHFRKGEQAPGREARRRAVELDGDIMETFPDSEDRLNRALVAQALSHGQIMSLANETDGVADDSARQVRLHLAGAVPSRTAPFLPLVALPVLFIASLVAWRWRPASACIKCGRSACARCDPEVGGGLICGQCVNVFQKKKGVPQRMRLIKEARIRRYQAWREGLARALSLVLPGSGHVLLDRPLHGVLLLFVFAWGVVALLMAFGPLPVALQVGDPYGLPRLVVSGVLILSAWLSGNWMIWRSK